MLLFDYCNSDFFVPANDEALAAASHNSRFRSTVEPMRTLCVCAFVSEAGGHSQLFCMHADMTSIFLFANQFTCSAFSREQRGQGARNL